MTEYADCSTRRSTIYGAMNADSNDTPLQLAATIPLPISLLTVCTRWTQASHLKKTIIGQVVDGRFRIEARVATGGMGSVYRLDMVVPLPSVFELTFAAIVAVAITSRSDGGV